MTQNRPPDNYYSNYFMEMIRLASNRYGDILDEEDVGFITQVKALTEPSLRLLVRLYIRKGPHFLVEKLTYTEVPNISLSIDELLTAGLLEENPHAFAFEVANLLPVAQARQLFSADKKEKKSDLIERLLMSDALKRFSDWGVDEKIICPTHYDSFRRLQLYYFGTERQSLTDFVLEDLGIFKYENYLITRANRLFNSAEEVDVILKINDLSSEFFLLAEKKDWHELPALAHRALSLKPPATLYKRWHRLLNRIALRLEINGELDLAEQLFRTNDRPLARERLVRIHFKNDNFPAALDLLNKIESEPKSNQELTFYNRFINKVTKKLNLPPVVIKKPYIKETYLSWPKGEGSVEQQACQHIEGAVWLENALPLAIFGAVHWSVVYADVNGVWHHPFQSGPTDLYDLEFSEKRFALIEDLHSQTKAVWRENIVSVWSEKQGIRNPFISWGTVDLEAALRCFDCLTKHQWLGVFQHLLSDLKQHRSGFPDLFQAAGSSCRFIEIKGPGDKLQDNQIRWLTVFQDLAIPAEVCYVRYEN